MTCLVSTVNINNVYNNSVTVNARLIEVLVRRADDVDPSDRCLTANNSLCSFVS